MARRLIHCILAAAVLMATLTAPGAASADEFHAGERLNVFADPVSGRALVRVVGDGIEPDAWSIVGPDRIEIASFGPGIVPSSHAVTPDGGFLVSGSLGGGVFGYTLYRLDGTSVTVETDSDASELSWPDPRRPDLISVRTTDGEVPWRAFDYITGAIAPFGADLLGRPTATADGPVISYDYDQSIVRFSETDGTSKDVAFEADLDLLTKSLALGPNSAVFVATQDHNQYAFFVDSSGTVDRVRIAYQGGSSTVILATSRPDEIIVAEHEASGGNHFVVQRVRSDGQRSITSVPTGARSLQRSAAARVDDNNIWIYEGNDWTDIEVPAIPDLQDFNALDTDRNPVDPPGGLSDDQPATQTDLVRGFELTKTGAVSADGASMLLSLTADWNQSSAYNVLTSEVTALDPQTVGRVLAVSWHEPSDAWIAIVAPGEAPSIRRVVSIGRDGTILWSRDSSLAPNTIVIGVSRGRGVDDVVVSFQGPTRSQAVQVVNAFATRSIDFEGSRPRVGMASDTTRGAHLIAVSDEDSDTLNWALVGGPGLVSLAGGTIPAISGLGIRSTTVPQVAVDPVSGVGVIVWGEHWSAESEPWIRIAIIDLDDGSVVTNVVGRTYAAFFESLGLSAHDGLIQLGFASGQTATIIELAMDGRAVQGSASFPTDTGSTRTLRVVPVHDGPLQGLVVSFFFSSIVWTQRNTEPINLDRSGYWMLGTDGAVYPFGDAKSYGDLREFIVVTADIEPTRPGDGYWLLTEGGDVFPFGGAGWWSDPAQDEALLSGETATAISSTPSGGGYWVFTDRGNVLTYGDAQYFGDVGHLSLSGPVIDAVATASGGGYYMVASDGGVFAFGDAPFLGSVPQVLPGVILNERVIGLAPTPDNRGYWLVAADGGVFAFNAPFQGSLPAVLSPGTVLAAPINGMVPYGDGYLLVGGDGGVFTFSNLPFQGSLGASPPASAVVAIAPLD